MKDSIGPGLRRYWRLLSRWPAGTWLFSRVLGHIAPYSATLGAHVRQLEPGYCRVDLREHRRIRNHLQSVHAMALAGGVDGLICVNDRAGGHTGTLSAQRLLDELLPLGKPLVCAGGVGTPAEFAAMLAAGYAAAQLGTRFIASTECTAHGDYKQAILQAGARDIVLTDKISGVPAWYPMPGMSIQKDW